MCGGFYQPKGPNSRVREVSPLWPGVEFEPVEFELPQKSRVSDPVNPADKPRLGAAPPVRRERSIYFVPTAGMPDSPERR
jgi:hypothetical protein